MTECFTPDGHLTEDALTMLIRGELDELSRLEVGEHLSFCDACLERYTAMLTQDVLETPAIDAVRPVMWQVKKQKRWDTIRRYASAAAAVAVTAALWYGGVFNTVSQAVAISSRQPIYEQTRESYEKPHPWEAPKPSFSERFCGAVDTWQDRVQEAADSFFRVPDGWK